MNRLTNSFRSFGITDREDEELPPYKKDDSRLSQSLTELPEVTPRGTVLTPRRRLSNADFSPRDDLDVVRASLPEQLKAREILDKQDAYFAELLEKVPRHIVVLKQPVGKPPICVTYNNYGLKPDADTDIRKKGGTISITVDGQHKTYEAQSVFTDGKLLFPVEKAKFLADATLATKNTRSWQCFALGDGCSLGERPKLAAELAVKVGLKVLKEQLKAVATPVSTRDIAMMQLKALVAVQNELEAQGDKMGETTLTLACVAAPFLVVASVGDSKVFVLRKQDNKPELLCSDITRASRFQSQDAKDPGGRLGAPRADWRNLAVAIVALQPHDIVLCCSDGIHDNFDPAHLGLTPEQFGFPEKAWDINNRHHVHLRHHELTRNIAKLVQLNPDAPIQEIINYVVKLTKKSKLFMLDNPTKPLPQDYSAYPGKDDHLSVISFTYEPLKKKSGSLLG